MHSPVQVSEGRLSGNVLFPDSLTFWNWRSVFRTACLLPSILSKLDDILLIKELNAKYFDHSITENQLLAAVSTPSTLADVDYERLELLGVSLVI